MLDAAADAPATRAPEGALGTRDQTEGHAGAARPGAGDGEHDVAGGHRAAQLGRRRVAGVDPQHREVAFDVGAGQLALGLAAVGEGDRGGAVAEVVGVGGHEPVGDDEAAAAAATVADPHDGGSDLVSGGAGGVGEGVEEGGHGAVLQSLATCK